MTLTAANWVSIPVHLHLWYVPYFPEFKRRWVILPRISRNSHDGYHRGKSCSWSISDVNCYKLHWKKKRSMVLVIPQYIDFSWEKKPAPTSESIECDTKTNNVRFFSLSFLWFLMIFPQLFLLDFSFTTCNRKTRLQETNKETTRSVGCLLLVFFLAPQGLGKTLHNSQSARTYYMLNNRTRCLYYSENVTHITN